MKGLFFTLPNLSRRRFLRHSALTLAGLVAASGGAVSLLPSATIAAKPAADSAITVPPTLMLHTKDRWKLEKIIIWLAENGYQSLNYQQLLAIIENDAPMPAKPVILTIDDIGSHYIQPYFLAMADVVEAAGFNGVFGVVSRDDTTRGAKQWAALRELAARGWEMDSHTNRHVSIPRLKDDAELRSEIIDSVARVRDGIGVQPYALIAPYGNVFTKTGGRDFDLRIIDAVREADVPFLVGIVGGRTIELGAERPYYVGRVGPGTDYVQTAWLIENF
jgi:peptidoglycan/xylan/chitin deacetylase (PgdA/CDA1 family)